MLTVCAIISTLTPLLAVGLSRSGWQGLLPVFFLAGAVLNGRNVGFSSALLELSPAAERPTFASVNASYPALFLIAAGFIALGAVWTRRLPSGRPVVSQT